MVILYATKSDWLLKITHSEKTLTTMMYSHQLWSTPSIQILLALVAHYELELDQLDMKTTFLYGDLKEKIYISQPTGFKIAGKEHMICKLKNLL